MATVTFREDRESICKEDVQNWIRRLRKVVSREHKAGRGPAPSIRYFACGEYGEERGRPHYHALFFGLPFSRHSDAMVLESWNKDTYRGFTHVSEFSEERAAYVARYTTKKLSKELWEKEYGSSRTPPFALMSRRPGVGHGYCTLVAQSVAQSAYWKSLEQETLETPSMENLSRVCKVIPKGLRVPSLKRAKGKVYPLDRYMRNQITVELCKNLPLDEKKSEIMSYMLESSDPFEEVLMEAEKIETMCRRVRQEERPAGSL